MARVVGVVFVLASLPKFLAYGWELDNFRRFGLPAAPVWVIAAGVLELAGGVLLARRTLIVPCALLLAVTMVVAVAVSGIAQGDVIPSLTVAPALLAALLWLLGRATRAPGGAERAPGGPERAPSGAETR
nr:DoxX family membrane protein [Paraconexibacter antarcticus]